MVSPPIEPRPDIVIDVQPEIVEHTGPPAGPAVVALGSGRGLDTAVAFAEGLTKSKAKTLLH